MSTKNMDVFALRDSVVSEYRAFATSFTTIFADDVREQVASIYEGNRYWPEPLIQINPSYRSTTDVQKLVDAGVLHPGCSSIFQAGHRPLTLYKHQEQAIALANQHESYVVTTGTGSGKSLCFFIPVVSAVLRAKATQGGDRTRAVVIYPMNALANSQMEELEKFIGQVQGGPPVTYARFTGQDDTGERTRVADNPPDILLTNFMMLELLMTRQDELDRKVMAHCAGLRFLVLDELHTYRGRQGADVALLVRRVRERLAPERLQCVGTSATMASQGSIEEKNRAVARVASRLFATEVPESNVVVETLERVTDPAQNAVTVKSVLAAALSQPLPTAITDAALRVHPLAIWVETTLGISWSDMDHQWVRARPRTVSEATEALAKDSGVDAGACREALRAFLLLASIPESERTGAADGNPRSFFAFKLHQFLSGAGHLYATLEPPGVRTVTVEAQRFLPAEPEKRLYPVHFCRECGHEYHPVRIVNSDDGRDVLERDIDDSPASPSDDDPASEAATDTQEEPGFLTLHAADAGFRFNDREEDYPESWLEYDAQGNPRLRPNRRKVRPRSLRVKPTGAVGEGTHAWFLPGGFRFCLRCGTEAAPQAKDRNRLASLSAEGRSSATTVLVGSALRWMHGANSGLEPVKRKLLGFTDNRQDAALQAGHFNDFLFVSLVRAGFLGALDKAGAAGLRSPDLGEAQQKALGFDRRDASLRAEWLLEPGLKGYNFVDAEATLRKVLAYRVWFDQRRGWRFTNPNLEQLRLLEVDYQGLDDLAADEELFAAAPDPLRLASPALRARVYRKLLDHFRQWMAVKSNVLDQHSVEQLLSQSHARLRTPWGFSVDEKPRAARWLLVAAPSRRALRLRDEDLVVRAGSRSTLGKALRSLKLWDGNPAVRDMKAAGFDGLVTAMLAAAKEHGLVLPEATPFDDATGWKLVDGCVVFRRKQPDSGEPTSPSNGYFRDYYASLAAMLAGPQHPLFGMEAREHTAQVDQDKRQVREKRFRYDVKAREELAAADNQLREMDEANRFLPIMFCSPTMELGVDISALNAVYLRNVPPTPANYAQRSGRAGRSGQAALVLTYCAARSPHDQYFFRDPKSMVHGDVRAPLLDLANRDLVESHLQAVWLAATAKPLEPSIAELLVLPDPARPLQPALKAALDAPGVAVEAASRIKRVLDMLADDLTPEHAPWFPGRDAFAQSVAKGALARLEQAFDRWRDLFLAAEQQRDAAHRVIQDYAAPPAEKRAAERRYAQALDQLNLLQQGTRSLSSDFYTYRYLATEGFLPGYNFPRLPLMAYVPAAQDGRGRQTYLQRPRFLALAEFGPRSLVYHEGRAFRVVRALLSIGQQNSGNMNAQLPTYSMRICHECGAGHVGEGDSACHSCGIPLDKASIVNNIFRIENVATQPAERITANDEERQRQGFELQTTYQWAIRDHAADVRRGAARDASGDVVRLSYGPGATITRLNKGLRRRADKPQFGFRIDPVTGYWAKNKDDDTEVQDPTANPRQWIVPAVQDRKNALLLQPAAPVKDDKTLPSLQHALLRGLEAVFQLEEGEVLAEPMPDRDNRRGFLIYEATEGGAGVLTQLVSDPSRLALVARTALRIMHFDVPASGDISAELHDVPGTACVAACYRCLMSYYNQPDHESLDRTDLEAQELLRRLSVSQVDGLDATPAPPAESEASGDGPLARWLVQANERGLPMPDADPILVDGTPMPLAWRKWYAAAVVGAPPKGARAGLEALGFALVAFDDDETTWDAPFKDLASALGR